MWTSPHSRALPSVVWVADSKLSFGKHGEINSITQVAHNVQKKAAVNSLSFRLVVYVLSNHVLCIFCSLFNLTGHHVMIVLLSRMSYEEEKSLFKG